MKRLRAAAPILALIPLAGWIAHAIAPWASDRWSSATLQTAHFRITSPPADAALAGRVAAVLESECRRVSSALGHDLRRPVNVRVTSSRLLYNLSCGLPFPTPPGDGFDGAAGDRGVTVLMPRDWKLRTETEIPDRGRTLAIHEVTHMLIFEMNPAVLDKRWLNEGVAWYLSLGMDTPAMRRLEDALMADDLRHGSVPLLSAIASNNQANWVRRQGDLYGRQFVLYAAQRFGAAAVPAMVRHAGNLRLALGKDEADLHADWVYFLKTRSTGASAPASGSVVSSPL